MERRNDMARFEQDVFAMVAKTEKSALDAARKWAKSVGERAPMEMPVFHEVMKDVLDFTEDVLRLQRELVHKVLTTTLAPQTGRTTARRPSSAAAHRATKPGTTKAA